MSEVRPLMKASPKRHISGTQLKAANHLRFFHGEDESLEEVEFETHPLTKVLNVIFERLNMHRVCIVDSATRITRSSLFQRFRLAEVGGAPLLGERRHNVEALFLEALATLSPADEQEDEYDVAVG
ncbi:MAG TPA: hypothetical protein VHO25_08655 [Polyangiaceae bacterium]|nr:hypothetical protein [Polyangiaceae bacterium]